MQVQLLVKAGAILSMEDRHGRNALYRAREYLDEAINKLAQASTTEKARESYKERKKNYENIINILLGEKKLTNREKLLQALQEVDINALKKLIPESFSIRSAFNLAIEQNYIAGMNAILNTFSSDLHKQNKDGDTLLMLIFDAAIRKNELSAVNLLINYGADVNKADKIGRTSLMNAARESTPAIMQVLLQKGADPNAIGGYAKQTPLMYAIATGNFDAILPLLNANANPLIKNEAGQDALDIAEEELAEASEEAERGRRFQQKKENYEKIIKLLESKIPPAILEQKRQKQMAKEQARQQEAARLAQEKSARQEQERQKQAQAERERLAEEARKTEERLKQEQLTRERLEQEKREQQKREQERIRIEQERLERERQRLEQIPIPSDQTLLSTLYNFTQSLRVLHMKLTVK